MKDQVFVSSVQKELAPERQAVRDFVRNDALLRKYSDVFLFEELPATATRDLDDLVRKGVILRVGAGRGAHYVKAKEMPQK